MHLFCTDLEAPQEVRAILRTALEERLVGVEVLLALAEEGLVDVRAEGLDLRGSILLRLLNLFVLLLLKLVSRIREPKVSNY